MNQKTLKIMDGNYCVEKGLESLKEVSDVIEEVLSSYPVGDLPVTFQIYTEDDKHIETHTYELKQNIHVQED